MKYTKDQISRAMKDVKRIAKTGGTLTQAFEKAAKTSGINPHTLRYYAITKNKIPKSTTKRSLKNPPNELFASDIKSFAKEISAHLVSELKQIFRV